MQQLNKKSNVLDASAFVGASFCRYPVGVLQGGSRFLVPDLHLHYGGRLWRKYVQNTRGRERRSKDKVDFLYNLLSNSIIAGREDAPKDW